MRFPVNMYDSAFPKLLYESNVTRYFNACSKNWPNCHKPPFPEPSPGTLIQATISPLRESLPRISSGL